jgi:hypothetical protein
MAQKTDTTNVKSAILSDKMTHKGYMPYFAVKIITKLAKYIDLCDILTKFVKDWNNTNCLP